MRERRDILVVQCFFLRHAAKAVAKAAIAKSTNVPGSGTAVNDELDAAVNNEPDDEPPEGGSMVNVAPAPMVRVPWTTEDAVNCVLADSVVLPVPDIAATVLEPLIMFRRPLLATDMWVKPLENGSTPPALSVVPASMLSVRLEPIVGVLTSDRLSVPPPEIIELPVNSTG
jgi:hypothetical protein